MESNFYQDLKEDTKKVNSVNAMEDEQILCDHCKRTNNNGLHCLGICVADSDY